MNLQGTEREGLAEVSISRSLGAPIGGLNSLNSLASTPLTDAIVFENWVAYPDRVEMRKGFSNYAIGFSSPVDGLWVWAGPALSRLFATTASGIYDITNPGVYGSIALPLTWGMWMTPPGALPEIALTNGQTVGTQINTGAANFLLLVNGTDTLKEYNGTAWSSVATLGSLDTTRVSAVETYRQRIFLIEKDTLNLWFLPANSVTGTATSFNLGSYFRRGGHLVALATWTMDGGTGPDDHLAIVTSEGEVVVFAGSDPAVAANWVLRGVFYVARPLGPLALTKYGGDLLLLSESGLLPLSKNLQSASIARTQNISQKVQQTLADLATLYKDQWGWQVVAAPDIPLLFVNVPGTTLGTQLVMHAQTGAWSIFSGWKARSLARFGTQLFFGTNDSVAQGWTGSSDNGVPIVSTLLQAYNPFKMAGNKKFDLIRPFFEATGSFSYAIGVANDFEDEPTTNLITAASSAALWGQAYWGAATWSASQGRTRVWRGVPDRDGVYKALYIQVRSSTARVKLFNTDLLLTPGGLF